MNPTFFSVTAGFVLIAAVLWPLERLAGGTRRQRLWRRGSRTDLLYWFFTPLVTRPMTRIAVAVVAVSYAALHRVPLERDQVIALLTSPRGLMAAQPLWLQAVVTLVLGDLVGYWMHRLFHGARLWPFHAVHHSSTDVDWLSAVRLHPVNDVVVRLAQLVPALLLGLNPGVLAAYVPFLTLYAILLHANLPWSFGPLRHVVASPVFHRWHHTSEAEGMDKNFAFLFPVFDHVFGTFHMPEGREPRHFGIEGDRVPDGLVAQLLYPFRRPSAAAAGRSFVLWA